MTELPGCDNRWQNYLAVTTCDKTTWLYNRWHNYLAVTTCDRTAWLWQQMTELPGCENRWQNYLTLTTCDRITWLWQQMTELPGCDNMWQNYLAVTTDDRTTWLWQHMTELPGCDNMWQNYLAVTTDDRTTWLWQHMTELPGCDNMWQNYLAVTLYKKLQFPIDSPALESGQSCWWSQSLHSSWVGRRCCRCQRCPRKTGGGRHWPRPPQPGPAACSQRSGQSTRWDGHWRSHTPGPTDRSTLLYSPVLNKSPGYKLCYWQHILVASSTGGLYNLCWWIR